MHVAISLTAIASGFVVTFGMLTGRRLPIWTAIFLATTVLTSVTGFFIPFDGIMPGIILGVISLVLLAATIYALYGRQLNGRWRVVYAIGAVASFYLNFLVLIVQSFQKLDALNTLAPPRPSRPS